MAGATFAPLVPIQAGATIASAGVCTANFQLSFSPNLRAVPQINVGIGVSGGISCVQAPFPILAGFNGGNLVAPVASCEEFVATGIMDFPPLTQTSALGSGQAQTWVMESTNPPLETELVGQLVWANTPEINQCRQGGGTPTMTLTGILVFADPRT